VDSPRFHISIRTGSRAITEQVIAAYDRNAAKIAARNVTAGTPWERFIEETFQVGDSILELGAGIGDVAAQLIAKGCSVVACEPSAAMRAEAVKRHPEIASVLADDALPLAPGVHEKEFDGVACLAVLMHLPEVMLFDATFCGSPNDPFGKLTQRVQKRGLRPSRIGAPETTTFNSLTLRHCARIVSTLGHKLRDRIEQYRRTVCRTARCRIAPVLDRSGRHAVAVTDFCFFHQFLNGGIWLTVAGHAQTTESPAER
jgi:Methyltransferase domain